MYEDILQQYKNAEEAHKSGVSLLNQAKGITQQPFVERLQTIAEMIEKRFPRKVVMAGEAGKPYDFNLNEENGGFDVKASFYNRSTMYIPPEYLTLSNNEIRQKLKQEDPEVFKNWFEQT